MKKKLCPKCKESKDSRLFEKNMAKPDGLSVYCKGCLVLDRAARKIKADSNKPDKNEGDAVLCGPMTDKAKAAILDFFGVIKIDGVML